MHPLAQSQASKALARKAQSLTWAAYKALHPCAFGNFTYDYRIRTIEGTIPSDGPRRRALQGLGVTKSPSLRQFESVEMAQPREFRRRLEGGENPRVRQVAQPPARRSRP